MLLRLFSHTFIQSETIHWSYSKFSAEHQKINTREAREMPQLIKFLGCKHGEYLSLELNIHGKASDPTAHI